MIEVDHCQIVGSSLAGEGKINEQTFASLAILSERLERVRKLDKIFHNVAFSPAVKELKDQKSAIAVG